ncbi:MAG: hypothetical protein LBE61_03465 [Burkholderiaceae bacterium]|jgi:hypothetical protein|nr:hypothetical protein [Burkholderiaceae bacterium]
MIAIVNAMGAAGVSPLFPGKGRPAPWRIVDYHLAMRSSLLAHSISMAHRGHGPNRGAAPFRFPLIEILCVRPCIRYPWAKAT